MNEVELLKKRITTLENIIKQLVKSDRYIFQRDIQFLAGRNLQFDTTTGTKFGTATDQLIGFYNTTPVSQQTTGVSAASFTASTGTAVNVNSTFGGYTIGQVVKALQNLGFLA